MCVCVWEGGGGHKHTIAPLPPPPPTSYASGKGPFRQRERKPCRHFYVWGGICGQQRTDLIVTDRNLSTPLRQPGFVLILFSVPTSGPQLVYQRPWYVLFCLWKSAYKRSLAAYRKE